MNIHIHCAIGMCAALILCVDISFASLVNFSGVSVMKATLFFLFCFPPNSWSSMRQIPRCSTECNFAYYCFFRPLAAVVWGDILVKIPWYSTLHFAFLFCFCPLADWVWGRCPCKIPLAYISWYSRILLFTFCSVFRLLAEVVWRRSSCEISLAYISRYSSTLLFFVFFAHLVLYQ